MSDHNHTPGPWHYVKATEHHGPYVTSDHGSDVCDCYTMTQPSELSTRNGGTSRPVPFLGDMAGPNARLIAAAPDLLSVALYCIDNPEFDSQTLDRMARAAIAKAMGDQP